jgi:hypothetical protein
MPTATAPAALSPPKDYSPQLPQQVRDQIAAATALRAEIDKSAQPADNGPPAQEPQPSPQPAPQVPPQAPAEEGDIEQRYRSLMGRFDQLMANSRGQQERINELERQAALLRARGAEPPPATPTPPTKVSLLTEQERTEYGEELLNVVAKRAKEEYAPEFDMLAQRLQRLEGRLDGVGQVVEHTQVQDLYGTLARAVPDWRAINNSDEFKLWLQRPDAYSGRNRHEMLLEAFNGHETGRVVAFFQGFLSEATGTPPNASSPGSSAPPLATGGFNPTAGNGSGRPSLESFAAPVGASSTPQPLPPEKPVYTHAWIAKFMADKRTGKYRGREAEAEAIERDIYQAQHEGRLH